MGLLRISSSRCTERTTRIGIGTWSKGSRHGWSLSPKIRIPFSPWVSLRREGETLPKRRSGISVPSPRALNLAKLTPTWVMSTSARKETNTAVTSYQKAVDLDPMKAAYHYNLSRAYAEETFLSGKKDQEFQRARQLDPQLIDYYSSIDALHGTPHINRLVIDEALSSERLWERFLSHFVGKEGWMFRLFHAWFEKIPSRLSFLTPILFLLFLIGMSRYSRAKRFLTRCPMCGSPTHRFYLGASDQEFICFNCYRIFVQKEKLHPKIVEKKSLQVREFQKQNHRISRFVSFFFVGFAYLWRGSFFRGLLFLFVFFVFVLRFIYWNGIVLSGAHPPLKTSGVFSSGEGVLSFSICWCSGRRFE